MNIQNANDTGLKFPDVYWADKSGTELAAECWKRWREYQEWLSSSGKLALYQLSSDTYYGRDSDGRGWATRKVRRHKDNAAVLKLKSNHYGSTARAKVTLVTAKPLSFQIFTTNTDVGSQSAASVARGLLEYVKRVKDLERIRKTLMRHAVNYTIGFVSVDWDPELGDDVEGMKVASGEMDYVLDENEEMVLDETDGQPLLAKLPKYGDIVIRNHSPVDIAYDFCHPDAGVRWYIARHFASRYDLAAKYPKLAQQILAHAPEKIAGQRLASYYENLKPQSSSDLIPVYRLVHERTPCMPDGREAYFLSDSILLGAGPLEYENMPVIRCSAEDTDDAPDGHSDMVDQLSLQEAHDAIISTALSKQSASLPKPIVSLQANIGKKDLGGGFNVFTVNGNPKDVFNFAEYDSSHEKDIELANYFQGQIETGTGINPVLRGNAEDALKGGSGRAYAFLQAQAAIHNHGLEGNGRDAMGKVAMTIVDTYRRRHTSQQQILVITGKSQEAQSLTFIGEKDLKGVRSISIEQGDSITQTPAGRFELLQLFRDLGVTGLDFNKAYQIATEGRWDATLEDQSNIDAHIRTENEHMANGITITPLEGEHHLKHILGHLALANRPGVDPMVASRALIHIRYHIYQWRIADPALLQVMGLPLLPPDPLFPTVDPRTGGMVPPAGNNAEQLAAQDAQAAGAEEEGAMEGEGGAAYPEEQGQGGGEGGIADAMPTQADQNPGMPYLPDGNEADPENQGEPPFPEME